MEITTLSTKDTDQLAKKIAKKLQPGDIVTLEGELGAGKTTFVRFLTDALGFKSRVQSPTFVIARRYLNDSRNGKIKIINHLDLYRLTTKPEVTDLGLEDYFAIEDSITLIEWPEIARDLLPVKTIDIKIQVIGDNERKFYVQNLS